MKGLQERKDKKNERINVEKNGKNIKQLGNVDIYI